jgi:hypothetical protein
MNSRRLIVAPEAQVRTTYRIELSHTVGKGMSALGHSRPRDSAPVPANVRFGQSGQSRFAPNSKLLAFFGRYPEILRFASVVLINPELAKHGF